MVNKFLVFAKKVLENAETPLTVREIWDYGHDIGITVKTDGKTPLDSLGSNLYVNTRDKEQSEFIKVGKNPARFWLRKKEHLLNDKLYSKVEEQEKNLSKKSIEKLPYKEKELHPILSYFVRMPQFSNGKAVYTKTIHHGKSKKKGFAEWTHPDLVGFYMPIDDWEEKTFELVEATGSSPLTFYSFEMKKRITKSDYREYFFQTVSNSSWANESYLVAAEFDDSEELNSELLRLSNAFGIGIIRLDLNDINLSEILFPAKIKKTLDWSLVNKLYETNKDFQDFIDKALQNFKIRKVYSSDYDAIQEDIEAYIKGILKK